MVFDPDLKIGALMENTTRDDMAKRWWGVVPPDLTLVARARGTDWLYAYLRTFYVDDSRPWGVNNRVFPDVAMPHALLDLQGLQACAMGPVAEGRGGVMRDPLTGRDILADPCGQFRTVQDGSLSTDEFDRAMFDLVNFLAYLGEPAALEREQMGRRVLIFILIFFVFAWLLNREYWKDVH